MGIFGARFFFGESSIPNKGDIVLYLWSFENEYGLICIACKCDPDTDYPIAIHKYIHYQLYLWIMQTATEIQYAMFSFRNSV